MRNRKSFLSCFVIFLLQGSCKNRNNVAAVQAVVPLDTIQTQGVPVNLQLHGGIPFEVTQLKMTNLFAQNFDPEGEFALKGSEFSTQVVFLPRNPEEVEFLKRAYTFPGTEGKSQVVIPSTAKEVKLIDLVPTRIQALDTKTFRTELADSVNFVGGIFHNCFSIAFEISRAFFVKDDQVRLGGDMEGKTQNLFMGKEGKSFKVIFDTGDLLREKKEPPKAQDLKSLIKPGDLLLAFFTIGSIFPETGQFFGEFGMGHAAVTVDPGLYFEKTNMDSDAGFRFVTYEQILKDRILDDVIYKLGVPADSLAVPPRLVWVRPIAKLPTHEEFFGEKDQDLVKSGGLKGTEDHFISVYKKHLLQFGADGRATVAGMGRAVPLLKDIQKPGELCGQIDLAHSKTAMLLTKEGSLKLIAVEDLKQLPKMPDGSIVCISSKVQFDDLNSPFVQVNSKQIRIAKP